MLIIKNFIVLFFLVLVVSFSLIGCPHEPPEPPGQQPPDTTAACDEAGAEWVNGPDREGKIAVAWFPSSTDPSVMITDVASFHPLIGSYRAPLDEISNGIIRRFGGNTQIRFCCGSDNVSSALIVSQGNQEEFPFDASSLSEIISFGAVDLIKVQTWVTLHCQPTFDDHTDVDVDFPISVLTRCQKPNGDEYEIETTLTYRTLSSCNTFNN